MDHNETKCRNERSPESTDMDLAFPIQATSCARTVLPPFSYKIFLIYCLYVYETLEERFFNGHMEWCMESNTYTLKESWTQPGFFG